MKWCTKIKWTFFIFSMHLLQCMSSGCDIAFNNCIIDVYCSKDNFDRNSLIIENNDDDCLEETIKFHYDDTDNYYPLRFKTHSSNVGKYLFSSYTNAFLLLIVSLEVTNCQLDHMFYIGDMEYIKALNYSNNNLTEARINSEYEDKIDLEDIDLSHNSISLIISHRPGIKRLKKLNLSYNLLVNITRGVFEVYRYLEYLDLSHNKIVRIDNYTFEGLLNIKYLNMSYNNISDINVSLFRFDKLEELYLDNNNIENLSTQNFETLVNLQILTLNFNKIKTIQEETFRKTKSLVILKLHHNLLVNIQHDLSLTTTSLKTVDLANNLIECLPKDLFKNKNITSFSITGNNLKGSVSKGMFEGLQLVTELDLSHQAITAIEDYAFLGMTKLTTLLLNNNEIKAIFERSFNTLLSLNKLDLSNNLITNINFNKVDLIRLEIFDFNNNHIKQILREDFRDLNELRYLDFSQNNITKLETASFQTLQKIENLLLCNNPIGILSNNSFVGLPLVPVLDLSQTSITTINNGSFNGMLQLQDLNISRSSVNKLEHSAFVNTGNIKSIDLSFNKLTEFHVDGNHLKKLTSLYLNNNAILQISKYTFKHMSMLNSIIISYNSIRIIDDKCLLDQANLRYLDVSFNNNINLNFNASVINNTPTLDTLLVSGVENATGFEYTGSTNVSKLEISQLGIRNISMLHLHTMRHLTHLILSNNNIGVIDFSTFKNTSALEWLDLSFNNVSFIQPGTFKNNIVLHSLNLSHNSLTSLNFGSFRGLINLNLLDISYNNIRDIGIERFYYTPKLKVLIADHNKISEISSNFFSGHINLDKLSIGHNPLLCENVIMLKRAKNVTVSAINIDENNSDNIDGIVCNMPINNNKVPQERYLPNINTTISEILLDSSENRALKIMSDKNDTDVKDSFDKFVKYAVNQTVQLNDIKTEVENGFQKTNALLEKVLKVLLRIAKSQNKMIGEQSSNQDI